MNVVEGGSGEVCGDLSALGEEFLSIGTPGAVRPVVHIAYDDGFWSGLYLYTAAVAKRGVRFLQADLRVVRLRPRPRISKLE